MEVRDTEANTVEGGEDEGGSTATQGRQSFSSTLRSRLRLNTKGNGLPEIQDTTSPGVTDGRAENTFASSNVQSASNEVRDERTFKSPISSHTRGPSWSTRHRRTHSAASNVTEKEEQTQKQYAKLLSRMVIRPVEDPLKAHLHFILKFFAISVVTLCFFTKYVHWMLSIALGFTLVFVLRAILQTAIEDTAWEKAEQEALARANDDQTNNEDNVETVEWMNVILKTVWPLINHEYFVPFVDLLEDALMQQVPGIVHACRVEDLDQGNVPLRVQSLSLLDSSEENFSNVQMHEVQPKGSNGNDDDDLSGPPTDAGDFVNLEITFAYRSPASRKQKTKSNAADGVMSEEERALSTSIDQDSELPVDQIHMLIYMAIGLQKIAAVQIPVWCEVLGIEGRMRLRVQLVPAAPFVGHVAFAFVGMPKLEMSAKPLGRRMVIDAMHLPLISSYVLHSVEAVVKDFILPKSYTLNVASLLDVQDGPRNVYSLGAIVLVIHQGIDLPAADVNGLCDPFISVSFARTGKPIFTTRVLLRNRNPIWHEMAILLVSPDEVRNKEHLRMTAFDADRFSVDDPLGKVEVPIDKLIRRALTHKSKPNTQSLLETRTENLHPIRRGAAQVEGKIKYSVGFFRLSRPAQGGRTASKQALLQTAAGRHLESPLTSPLNTDKNVPHDTWTDPKTDASNASLQSGEESQPDTTPNTFLHATAFDRFVHKLGLPLDENILRERMERRTRVNKLTEVMQGEAQATLGPPSPEWPSGILAFHIHSIDGLGFEPPQRSYSTSKRLGQKPRYTEDEDAMGEGTSKMPNSYVQVLLNDEAIFRSRTKTLNPRPYINAGTERFVPCLASARIDFVIRDARQRESDPILGVVGLSLVDILSDESRKTQWYPITGGLGFGKIRITLLWRSVEINIPPPLRGFNVGVIEVTKCYIGGLPNAHRSNFDRRDAHMLFETVGGRAETDSVEPHDEYESGDGDGATFGFQWPMRSPIRIAVRQRYPNFLYVHLRMDSRLPGRAHKYAHTVIPLNSLTDFVTAQKRVPIFEAENWQHFEQDILRKMSTAYQLASPEDAGTHLQPVLDDICSDENVLNEGESSGNLKKIGFLEIQLEFQAGMASEHRARIAGDHELRVAYESWQALEDCGQRAQVKTATSTRKSQRSQTGSQPEEGDHADHVSEEASSSQQLGGNNGTQQDLEEKEAFNSRWTETAYSDGEDSDGVDLAEADTPEGRRARIRSLHRQHRGAAQIKSYRTLEWLKTNAEDGIGRMRQAASRQQSKRIAKMESEGVSHF